MIEQIKIIIGQCSKYYDKTPYEDLRLLLDASIGLANNLYDEKISEILPLEERKIMKK